MSHAHHPIISIRTSILYTHAQTLFAHLILLFVSAVSLSAATILFMSDIAIEYNELVLRFAFSFSSKLNHFVKLKNEEKKMS